MLLFHRGSILDRDNLWCFLLWIFDIIKHDLIWIQPFEPPHLQHNNLNIFLTPNKHIKPWKCLKSAFSILWESKNPSHLTNLFIIPTITYANHRQAGIQVFAKGQRFQRQLWNLPITVVIWPTSQLGCYQIFAFHEHADLFHFTKLQTYCFCLVILSHVSRFGLRVVNLSIGNTIQHKRYCMVTIKSMRQVCLPYGRYDTKCTLSISCITKSRWLGGQVVRAYVSQWRL